MWNCRGQAGWATRDTRHVDSATEHRMEALLSILSTTGRCSEYGCHSTSRKRTRQLHHVESHNILYLCSCGYFSSYMDATTKHERTRHNEDPSSLRQVNESNWISIRVHVKDLPKDMPALSVKNNDPARECQPDKAGPSCSNRRASPMRINTGPPAVVVVQPGRPVLEPRRARTARHLDQDVNPRREEIMSKGGWQKCS